MKATGRLKTRAAKASDKRANSVRVVRLAHPDLALVIKMVKSTPVTSEVLASAEKRAERAKAAKSAKFLDKYRTQAVAA